MTIYQQTLSDAGKSSVMWAVLRALAPWIRCGLVQVSGSTPQGGMELGCAEGLFQKLVCTNGADTVALLEHVATLTRQRAEALRRQGTRKWPPGSGQPFVLLVVDELADVIAYQSDNGCVSAPTWRCSPSCPRPGARVGAVPFDIGGGAAGR